MTCVRTPDPLEQLDAHPHRLDAPDEDASSDRQAKLVARWLAKAREALSQG